MNESELKISVDCCFLYSAPLRWRRVIAEAVKISPNAAFMVAHELCRPPRISRVGVAQRIEIWRHLSVRLHHPIVKALSSLIVSNIKGVEIPATTAIKAMMFVRRHPNQHNALSICYFSCSGFRKVDALYERIVCEWQNA